MEAHTCPGIRCNGNPQSLNLYGYVTDNPVSRQDGDGHLLTIYQLYSNGNDRRGVSTFSGTDGNEFSQFTESLQNTEQPPAQPATTAPPASGQAHKKKLTKEQQVRIAALQAKNLAECTTEFFGAGFRFTLLNLPYIDATQNLKDNAIGETKPGMVPDEGRGTILIDKGSFSSMNPVDLVITYLHEAANAMALQQFTMRSGPGWPDWAKGRLERWRRQYLGPEGQWPSYGQQHAGSGDHDIGNQFERCLNGSPLE